MFTRYIIPLLMCYCLFHGNSKYSKLHVSRIRLRDNPADSIGNSISTDRRTGPLNPRQAIIPLERIRLAQSSLYCFPSHKCREIHK